VAAAAAYLGERHLSNGQETNSGGGPAGQPTDR